MVFGKKKQFDSLFNNQALVSTDKEPHKYQSILDNVVIYTMNGCGWCAKQKEVLQNLDPRLMDIVVEDLSKVPPGINGFPTWVINEDLKDKVEQTQIPGFIDENKINQLLTLLES
jgi:hypothetical protein